MKLHFQSLGLDLYGEGPNVFAALSEIEEKLKTITGLDAVLADDPEVDWTELIYYENTERVCSVVGDYEENFSIKRVDLSE